jgi:hypothetical protein
MRYRGLKPFVLSVMLLLVASCGQTDGDQSQVRPPEPDVAVTPTDSDETPALSPDSDTNDPAVPNQDEALSVTSPFELQFSGVAALADVHGQMLRKSLPLVAGMVSDIRITDDGEREISIDVAVDQVLWVPGDGSAAMPSPTLSIKNAGAGAVEFFAAVALPSRVLLIADGSEPLGLAVLDETGSAIRPSEPAAGSIFLGEAIAQLVANPAPFFVDPLICQTQQITVEGPTDPVDVLVSYFDYYGDRTAHDVARASSDAWALADKLEGSVDLTEQRDEVTGQALSADINSIYLQLVAGVPASDVLAPPSMNMAVDLTGLDDERRQEYMVVFEIDTGRLLGWLQLGHFGQVIEDGEESRVELVVIEVLKPEAGRDVGVSFRPLEVGPPKLGCPVTDVPDLTISYVEAAGPQFRALILAAQPAIESVDGAFFAQQEPSSP